MRLKVQIQLSRGEAGVSGSELAISAPNFSGAVPFPFHWQHPLAVYIRATPTVLQMGFAFLFLQKTLQNSYPMVWQMSFAFLLTWQNHGMDWHICKLAIGLPFRLTHYFCMRSSLPRRRISFFRFWQVNFAKPLEITFFLLPILI
jgi:hypothetical protein